MLLREQQNNCCAICHLPQGTKNLSVDHCHTTGKIRGLLCTGCNSSLGLLKESVEVLNNMIEYIKKHNE